MDGGPAPEELARTAERLNGPGAEVLAGLADREILAAWEATVAAFLDPASEERRALGDGLVRSTRLSPEGLEAGLRAVLGGVRGEPAARTFAQAATARRRRGPSLPSAGFALVVLASNLPALAVQPLLPALAARRPALLKCPRAEPIFTPAFVRALVGRLPALGDALAVATWAGGDEAREAPLLERAGVVLAYGDEQTVASLERRAPAGRVVPYGPRTSLAVVGEESHPAEVAPGLARDVALFDQRGCLSVAAVYVEGGSERARAVAEALAAALRDLAERWPPGTGRDGASATSAAVRQLRALAEMRGLPLWAIGEGRPAGMAAGTVLLDPDPTFQPTPGLRTVRLHPLADVARLPAILAPWRDRLQGAALAGLDAEKAGTLVPALQALGISRITPPGHLQHPDTGWHNGGIDPLEVLITRP